MKFDPNHEPYEVTYTMESKGVLASLRESYATRDQAQTCVAGLHKTQGVSNVEVWCWSRRKVEA